MGGRMSRNKGARGERSLVMHLNLNGYKASRVIRTRAVRGIEDDVVPDVIAEKGGQTYTFESKMRKNSFETVYRLYQKARTGDVYRFALGSGGPYVAIGSDFEEVKKTRDVHFTNLVFSKPIEAKVHQRILNLHKMLKGAQFLVIKDNGKFPLFIRYWL